MKTKDNSEMIDTHITYSHKINGLVSSKKRLFPHPTKIEVRYSKCENADDTISFSDNENILIHIRVKDLEKILREYKEDAE